MPYGQQSSIFSVFLDAYKAKRSLDNEELQLKQEEARWRAANELSVKLANQSSENARWLTDRQMDAAEAQSKDVLAANLAQSQAYRDVSAGYAANQGRALTMQEQEHALRMKAAETSYNRTEDQLRVSREISKRLAAGETAQDVMRYVTENAMDPVGTLQHVAPLLENQLTAQIAKNEKVRIGWQPRWAGIPLPGAVKEDDGKFSWNTLPTHLMNFIMKNPASPGSALYDPGRRVFDANKDNEVLRQTLRELRNLSGRGEPLQDPRKLRQTADFILDREERGGY